jgi:hypothetical protein
MHNEDISAMPMQQAPSFVALLKQPDFAGACWGKTHQVWRGAVHPGDFISSAEIEQKLDFSLLRWPYFSLVHDGQNTAPRDYTCQRDVIGQKRTGFADAARIRQCMAQGASLKLNKLTDWHQPSRALRRALEDMLPVAVASYMFWTPADARGMLPHRDAAHVLAIQLEGRKQWNLYADPAQIASTAGLDVDSRAPTHCLVLEPGDVLYLPHGWPHDALALEGGRSLHLTFTLTEPTPEDLLEALLGHFSDGCTDLMYRHHARTLEDKSTEVRQALVDAAARFPVEIWVATALAEMRAHTG